MRFVGLDYDFNDKIFIRSVLMDLINEFDLKFIELFISPSGRGYHIKFFVDDFYTDGELLNIRKKYNDDPNRISMVGNLYRDVLFDIKLVDGNVMRSKKLDVNKFLLFGLEIECGQG